MFASPAGPNPRSSGAVVSGESVSKSGPWPGKVPFASHVKNIENMHRKLQVNVIAITSRMRVLELR